MSAVNYSLYHQLPGIVEKYQLPDNRKAVIQILNSLLPFLAIWAVMYVLRDGSISLTISINQ